MADCWTLRRFLDVFLRLAPAVRKVWGNFSGPASSARFGAVLEPHTCGVKRENGGPNRPHDAQDAVIIILIIIPLISSPIIPKP